MSDHRCWLVDIYAKPQQIFFSSHMSSCPTDSLLHVTSTGRILYCMYIYIEYAYVDNLAFRLYLIPPYPSLLQLQPTDLPAPPPSHRTKGKKKTRTASGNDQTDNPPTPAPQATSLKDSEEKKKLEWYPEENKR